MKYKEYITRLTNRLFRKRPIVRDPQIMHPDREWAIGLCAAALIFLISGYFSIHTYLSNRSAPALEIVDDKTEIVYRESIVKEALETVRNRERTFQRLTDQPVVTQAAVEETATTTPQEAGTEESTVDSVISSSTPPTEN